MSALEGQYRRLLRWYPQQWRARNESAVLGTLLDQAESTNRAAPSVGDRVSLRLGGLRERLRRPSPSVVALGAAIAFLVWYLAVIAQSFAHPSLVTLGVLAFALAVACTGRAQLAGALSVAAALSAIALAFTVEGPGPSVTVLIVGLALIAAIRGLRGAELVMLIAATVLAMMSAEAWRSLAQLWPMAVLLQFWIAIVVGMASGAGAILLSAVAAARRVAMGQQPAA